MSENFTPYEDFPALTPDERNAREDELTGDQTPEQALHIREARGWAALLDAARGGRTTDEELVRSYLFDESPPEDADPEAVRILEALQRRADPVGLFERLRNSDTAIKGPSVQRKSALRTQKSALSVPFLRWSRQSGSWSKVAFATLLVGAVVYAGLFTVGLSTLPDHTRIAELSDVGGSFRPPRVRGPERASLADQYEAAVNRLDDAHTSILGLFPSYDTERLDEAAGAFQAIRDQAEPRTAYHQEATLALARIRIQQQRFDEATQLLDELGASGGYRAPDAERLLDLVEGMTGDR